MTGMLQKILLLEHIYKVHPRVPSTVADPSSMLPMTQFENHYHTKDIKYKSSIELSRLKVNQLLVGSPQHPSSLGI